jgi:saccharopine dehydrogenase-like NADP-dependent oxidoreductase
MWSFKTYLEDCADKAIYWEDGRYKWAEPFTGEEEYYFPAPLDIAGKVFYHNHEEPLTIPKFIGKPVKYVDFKMGDPDSATWEFLLNGLKLMGDATVDIKGGKVSVKDVFCNQLPITLTPKKCIELVDAKKITSQAVLAVDVKGTKAGKKLHYKMWTDSPNIEKACSMIPGTNDVSWITSVPASVLSLMILRGQIKRTGVFPCEVFNKEERKIFFEGIKGWDVIIHKQITSDIA